MSVEIEISIIRGIPRHTVVGLPNAAVRESLDRIRAAILAEGLNFPRGAITINLAPADVRKEGTSFDLPIALGILAADGMIGGKKQFNETLIMGELALNGSVRPVRGILAALNGAMHRGCTTFVVPEDNVAEAMVLDGIRVFGVASLGEAVRVLSGRSKPHTRSHQPQGRQETDGMMDFGDVVGQKAAIRAMEVAATGGHNLLLIGPPGCGKTMLSRRLPSILPDWTAQEALDATCIHSLRGLGQGGLLRSRPFRAPHHSVSMAGMIGGGNPVLPGEVSLAHEGVLFLDELAEFSRSVLESLREPLEEGSVIISRAQGPVRYPARFQLIGAMNPCPCGFSDVVGSSCTCHPRQRMLYRGKVSGPLMDRIDMQVFMIPVDPIREREQTRLRSVDIKERVERARAILEASPISLQTGALEGDTAVLLNRAVGRLGLSMRALERIKKVSRTIAALDGATLASPHHLSEALRYRRVWK